MRRLFSLMLLLFMLISIACAESITQWDYDIIIMGCSLSGKYTGEILNGKPDGYGLYETKTPDGILCHYIGEWKDGTIHGNGAMYWNDGSLEIGEYNDGVFIAGSYNYNSLRLISAIAGGDATLNPHWHSKSTRSAMAEESNDPVVLYIGNRNSHVFHKLDCDSIRTMKEKNKVEFFSREDAVEMKYQPCDRCNP